MFGKESNRVDVVDQDGNAFSTVSGDGCINSAYITVLGYTIQESAQRFRDLKPIISEFYAAIEADPRSQQVWQDWSDCMSSHGFEFKHRDELAAAASPEAEQADDECAAQTDLDTTQQRIELAWESRLVETYPELARQLGF